MDEKDNGQSQETETSTQEKPVGETGTDDIKANPPYIAMKEMLDNQTAELEKLQKQVKDLQVEKENMALSYGLEDKRPEQLDNAWLGISRSYHTKKK